MDTLCRFSGPFALVSEAVSGDRSHQSRGFVDLKRFNGITRGGDFIVNEMFWQYYLCTDNKTKRKVIMSRIPIGMNAG